MSAETGSVNLKEQAVNFTTMRHIERVRNLLNKMVRHLLRRGELHDQSKLEPPESPLFAQYTDQLRLLTFGSQEYSDCKKKLGPALDHHYARNPHHPEFHKNGVADMNLIDLVEMICDWKAASERQSMLDRTNNMEREIKHLRQELQAMRESLEQESDE